MKTLSEWSSKFFDLLDMKDYEKPETAESDKLCFKLALKQFISSGKKEDAFSVYFCFSEIFKLFGQGYENTKKLLEMLSDHEYHSGELLSKHRDHYSHSVYVFALGLAIYANDWAYRANYLSFYRLKDDGVSAYRFLKFWGMVALFHDIGYPFQLAHEQIKTYAEEVWGKNEKVNPFVSYGNFVEFIELSPETRENLAKIFPEAQPFNNLNDLFAYGLQLREGYDPELVCPKLTERIINQPKFIDHGYFSAVILARQIFSVPNYQFDVRYLDVLTAILLHNNFNKYDAPEKHSIRFDEHPLAYLIILCDELQCWDRLAYGKVSKRDPIAWDCRFDIAANAIYAEYIYDSFVTREYNDGLELNVTINKNYQEMHDGTFLPQPMLI